MAYMKLLARLVQVTALLFLGATTCSAADRLGYGPNRDPFPVLQQALQRASSNDRLVLVIAGGDWCHTCHVLEAFLRKNPDIREEFTTRFEIVKVYIGSDNFNEEFFRELPELNFVPHFFVLSADGKVLGSQSTKPFLDGPDRYDAGLVRSFLLDWKSE